MFHSTSFLRSFWVSDSALLELCSRVSSLFWCSPFSASPCPHDSSHPALLRELTPICPLHDFLDFLSVQEFRHEVCFMVYFWDVANRCFSTVGNSLHPQPLDVHVSHFPRSQLQRHATSRYRICLQCNLDLLSVISGHVLHAQPNTVAVPRTIA